MNKKIFNTILAVIAILISLVIIITNIAYVFTETRVPGLLGFASAALMIPLLILWVTNSEKKSVWPYIIFLAVAVLEIFTAILDMIA